MDWSIVVSVLVALLLWPAALAVTAALVILPTAVVFRARLRGLMDRKFAHCRQMCGAGEPRTAACPGGGACQ